MPLRGTEEAKPIFVEINLKKMKILKFLLELMAKINGRKKCCFESKIAEISYGQS